MFMIDQIVKALKKLRILLLNEDNKELYKEINDFLVNPKENLNIYNEDINILEVTTNKKYISFLKDKLYALYLNNYQLYKQYIIDGQSDIWDIMYKTYYQLIEKLNRIDKIEVDNVNDRYSFACKEVCKIIDIVSESYSILSDFEYQMGLDRFLSYINQQDLNLLYEQIQKIKAIANKRLNTYKEIFQRQWNLTSISQLLKHMLIEEDLNSPITRNFPTGQDRVILFIIDGLGYAQYLWNVKFHKLTKKYTFDENIFSWLDGNKDFMRYIIGSSLISDTCAGLAQIFSGLKPKETGILSSKIYRRDYEKFYPSWFNNKSPIIDVKNTQCSFEYLISDNYSILQYLAKEGINSQIFFCSRYKDNKFSRFCFDNTVVHEILPPERVFSILFDEINDKKEKFLNVVYYTSLDNTGHPSGAFTLFELYEHKKINTLITNFIIQLAIYKPELFDGKTSFIFTADHGMAESSKKVISRREFEILFFEYIESKDSIIENNRSILFYNVKENKLEEAAAIIKQIFEKHDIQVKVYTKNDDIIKELLYDENTISALNCPDIIALIEQDGIVFSKNINKHLYHYGGHGGYSIEEVFVPLLCINLSQDLKQKIEDRFIKFT